jgi:3-oxoacyl-[acyl-carrier-protein] synthase-1
MSSPHPEGRGAFQAMQSALAQINMAPQAIDYVNLHGTATVMNDQMEDKALSRIFSRPVACSSTKGWTGHTLGAAGAVEAIVSALCIEHDFIPNSLNTLEPDPDFSHPVIMKPQTTKINTVATNSFGFGGNNCCLILADGQC